MTEIKRITRDYFIQLNDKFDKLIKMNTFLESCYVPRKIHNETKLNSYIIRRLNK